MEVIKRGHEGDKKVRDLIVQSGEITKENAWLELENQKLSDLCRQMKWRP